MLARPQVYRSNDAAVPGLLAPPSERFSPKEVAAALGGDRVVALYDSAVCSAAGEWTLDDLSDYFDARRTSAPGSAILNMLSLEVSGTPLERFIRPPACVLQLDWLSRPTLWPEHRRSSGQFPRVQRYCLLSAAGSFTEFHSDFGGSAVWYHMLRGRKRFFVIVPPAVPVPVPVPMASLLSASDGVVPVPAPGVVGPSAISRLAFLVKVHRWTTRSRETVRATQTAQTGSSSSSSSASSSGAGTEGALQNWLPS